jgi:6-phosphogluconolactonase (cycloisomerase 2 family)
MQPNTCQSDCFPTEVSASSARRLWLTHALMALGTAALIACGGGSSPPAPAPAPATSATAVIGPAGGTLTGPDGVQVIIPPGALNADTTIGIARSSEGAPPTPEAYPVAGYVYELTPHGVTFNSPVTVRAPLPAGAATPLVFMASQGEGWKLLEAQVANGMAEWQRNSFSNMFIGLTCFVPPAMNSDPYWCTHASSFATVTATPAAAMVRTGPIDLIRGDMGSRRVDQAATLQFTTHFGVPGNCANVTVDLRRFTYVGSALHTWSPPIIVQTKTPTLTVSAGGGKLVGSETFDFPFDHTLPAQNMFSVIIHFDCPGVAHSSTNGNVTGWDYSSYSSSYVGDLVVVTSNVPVPTAFFTVGGAVSGLTGAGLVLQNNGGNFTPVAASGNFSFSNTAGIGAPYNVTVLTQPAGQTCTVTNGSGTASANITTVAVACIPTFTVGGTVTGLLGTGLVLQNNGGDNLPFSVSGAFTFATKLPSNTNYAVTVLSQPSSSICSVANGTGAVTNANISNIAVTCLSSGALALVANSGVNNGTNGVAVYRANPSTGALAFLNNVDAGDSPWAIAVSPNGLYAYVTNSNGGTISSFAINNTTGAVTLIPLSSLQSRNSFGIAMDRLGRFLWTVNYGFSTVSAFSIGANGALTAVGAPLATPNGLPYAVAAHPTLDVVYVAHQSNFAISVYSVNPSTGALTQQQNLTNVITSANGLVIDPTGKFAYAVSGSGGVCALRINAVSGNLTTGACANPSGGSGTFSVAVHPNGQFLYTTSDSALNNVTVFAINQTTGAPTQVGSPATAGANPRGVTVGPGGANLYVTNYVGNTVSAFTIGGGGSTLTSLGAAVPAGANPVGVAVIP